MLSQCLSNLEQIPQTVYFSQHAEIREQTGESSCVRAVIMCARKNSCKLQIYKEKMV